MGNSQEIRIASTERQVPWNLFIPNANCNSLNLIYFFSFIFCFAKERKKIFASVALLTDIERSEKEYALGDQNRCWKPIFEQFTRNFDFFFVQLNRFFILLLHKYPQWMFEKKKEKSNFPSYKHTHFNPEGASFLDTRCSQIIIFECWRAFGWKLLKMKRFDCAEEPCTAQVILTSESFFSALSRHVWKHECEYGENLIFKSVYLNILLSSFHANTHIHMNTLMRLRIYFGIEFEKIFFSPKWTNKRSKLNEKKLEAACAYIHIYIWLSIACWMCCYTDKIYFIVNDEEKRI